MDVTKPEGGYCLISVGQLLECWKQYQEGHIDYGDIRVWFAAHELAARRCTLGRGRKAAYRLEELEPLVRVGKGGFRASLRRLEAQKLISWDSAVLLFPRPEAVERQERRPVPVPRRTIRFLAGCTKPVLAATVLAHLIRCLFYRYGECTSRGTCKASWVSETFGVHIRGVKAARKYLEQIGWLRVSESAHWHRQRWGATVVVNLLWPGLSNGERHPRKSAPRAVASWAKLPPPESNKKLPSGSRNQKLRPADCSGVKGGGQEAPRLTNIRPEDLLQFSRTEALYRQAVARGWVKHSESQALNWIGAAVRAKSVCGDSVRVFVGIVKQGLWHHITAEQEERARRALSRYRERNPELFRLARPPVASVRRHT